jgi:hypothetical protein
LRRLPSSGTRCFQPEVHVRMKPASGEFAPWRRFLAAIESRFLY